MAADGRLRVVIVDDDEAMRSLLGKLLVRTGALEVVGSAGDGDEALRVVEETQPDVVLVDLMLGDQRGIDLVGPLLRTRPTAMVAMLTAWPAESEEQPSLAAGAFVFYEKGSLPRLEEYIVEDHRLFARALEGEDVVAPFAVSRRRVGTGS